MVLGSVIIAAALASTTPSASATELMIELTRELCVRDQDRYETAHRLVPPSWTVTRTREERDIDFGVDAPVPLHDVFERSWRESVDGGTVWLSVSRGDFRDPARRDTSYAMLGISPAHLLDLAQYQDRLGIRLRPHRFPGDESGQLVPISQQGREVLIDGSPIRRPVQHYAVPAPASPVAVEIRARHILDDEYPERLFDVSCSTRL